MVDFIGIGAQKAGTSWVYACLYEHPEICAPLKEIHFFSRPRFKRGQEWYEDNFNSCDDVLKKGEFSTSYLYSVDAASRIARMYPEAKLIAILRNPIERAYSHYCNSLKAGEIAKDTPFHKFESSHSSTLEQGLYTKQLKRYLQYFSKQQLLILIYEDIEKDPSAFIKRVYEHIGVDSSFEPTMLHQRVNVARIPRFIILERIMHRFAEFLRKIRLDKLVWFVRVSGLPDRVRTVNTERSFSTSESHGEVFDRAVLKDYFAQDVKELSIMLGRDLETEWGFDESTKTHN